MKMWRQWLLTVVIAMAAAGGFAQSKGRAAIDVRARDPYLGAIAVDGVTGRVLFEERADEPGYPASVIKLMDLLIVRDKIQQGSLTLATPVPVSAAAAGMGGSQVYLAEKEVFPLEDMLYALMIQSANDVAHALAELVAGSPAGFVALMNARAAELGMAATKFQSVHGLPPAAGQAPDVSTARDLATLARALVKHPDVLNFTSTRERGFRDGQFMMRTHNSLLGSVEGCDGLKTGYFKAGGYSIVVTAAREGRRVIVVVLGSPTKQIRDAKARELLAQAFLAMPAAPPPSPVRPMVMPVEAPPVEVLAEIEAPAPKQKPGLMRRLGGGLIVVGGVLLLLRIGMALGRRRAEDL